MVISKRCHIEDLAARGTFMEVGLHYIADFSCATKNDPSRRKVISAANWYS